MRSSGQTVQRAAVAVLLATVAAVAGCADDEPDAEAQLARGEDLYATHCVECHGGATGGDIGDIPPPHNAEGHTWHHGDCEIIEWTLEGMPERPGAPTMPAFGDELDVEDAEAILAYIKTWWEDDQRELQERVTAQVCE